MSTILDIWEDPETTGIFTTLQNYNVPWANLNIDQALNLAYYYNHSGQKNISPLVSGILGSSTTLTSNQIDKIGKVVYSLNSQNWQYLWNAIFADYDPIENFNGVEEEKITNSGSRSGTTSNNNTGTDTLEHSGTVSSDKTESSKSSDSGTDSTSHTGTRTSADSGIDSQTSSVEETTVNSGNDTTTNTGTVTSSNSTEDGTTTTSNEIYGYNSTDAANDSKSTVVVNQTVKDTRADDLTTTLNHGLSQSHTGTNKESTSYGKSNTLTDDLSDSISYGHVVDLNIDNKDLITYNNSDTRTLDLKNSGSNSEESSGTTERSLSRHGNLGVTTSQQMIESEIELRKKNYFNIIMQDIDHYLALSIY